jgi:DNA-binding transcriptional LysR family regulator
MHRVQLSALDLNLLRVLHALLETGSVKGAAARVSLSPSATSHALARLREQVGDPLLLRSGRRLVLTARAERLRGELSRALVDLERLLSPAHEVDPSTIRRRFRVAASDYAELEGLLPVSTRLAEEAPGIDLHAVPEQASMVGQLRSFEVELALGVGPALPDDIAAEPLFSDPFVCLFRKGHPALRAPLTVERFAALEHVLVSPRGGAGGLVDRRLAEFGLTRHVARTVSNFLVAPRLVATSEYVLTTAERVARAHARGLGLVIKRPPLALAPIQVRLAWHRRFDHDLEHAWLRRLIVETIRRAARHRADA